MSFKYQDKKFSFKNTPEYLIHGDHVELEGVHGGDEVLGALSNHGGGSCGSGGGCGLQAMFHGGGHAGCDEAMKGGWAVNAVGFHKAIYRGDSAGEGRGEGAELGDKLEALGLVLGGTNEIPNVRFLQLLHRLEDRVKVCEAVIHLPFPLVVPKPDLHGSSHRSRCVD